VGWIFERGRYSFNDPDPQIKNCILLGRSFIQQTVMGIPVIGGGVIVRRAGGAGTSGIEELIIFHEGKGKTP
jgi:hypothetical protein